MKELSGHGGYSQTKEKPRGRIRKLVERGSLSAALAISPVGIVNAEPRTSLPEPIDIASIANIRSPFQMSEAPLFRPNPLGNLEVSIEANLKVPLVRAEGISAAQTKADIRSKYTEKEFPLEGVDPDLLKLWGTVHEVMNPVNLANPDSARPRTILQANYLIILKEFFDHPEKYPSLKKEIEAFKKESGTASEQKKAAQKLYKILEELHKKQGDVNKASTIVFDIEKTKYTVTLPTPTK